MKLYLEALDLWITVEDEYNPTPLPTNPTLAQIKKHEEQKTKKPKALGCIFSAVSEGIFTSIMTCKTPKEAWECIKEEYEGNKQTKMMQLLNLKREFERLRMQDSDNIKNYGSKLMTIVNQIRLHGEDFPNKRVVEKLLVSLPERSNKKSHLLKILKICQK